MLGQMVKSGCVGAGIALCVLVWLLIFAHVAFGYEGEHNVYTGEYQYDRPTPIEVMPSTERQLRRIIRQETSQRRGYESVEQTIQDLEEAIEQHPHDASALRKVLESVHRMYSHTSRGTQEEQR